MPPSKPPTLSLLRSFSSTPHPYKPNSSPYHNRMPPYPYGPALQYKQSNSGLYGGSSIQFGNLISSKNALKSRRSWHPNIHNKRLWSDALQGFVQVKVQARVLRTIDKVGGLDEYLLGDKPARIRELGVEGWRLRWKVMRSQMVRERIGEERVRLGLPAEGWRESERQEVGMEVEEVVERVKGGILGQIGAETEDEISLDEQQEIEPMKERPARTVRDLEHQQSSEKGNERRLPREMKIPRLVGIRETPKDEGDETTSTKDTAAHEKPDIVQADDSKSTAGKAIDRLKGLLGR